MKKNIRYVLVYLGSGGFTPNSASAVLRNRFGDCKDHVVLMAALLKAKEIASVQALVNLGDEYKMPPIPMPFFQHVIVFIPEFQVYTDPTAFTSAFGVLPPSLFDKPALLLTNEEGALVATPAMSPQNHWAAFNTTIFVEADGTVRGETVQTAEGVFAASLRAATLKMQRQGRSRFAETILREQGTPGKATYERPHSAGLTATYTVRGSFVLSDKFDLPLSGNRIIPKGLPIVAKPISWFFGPRVPGRETDFICYAGRQIQDIAITFADGLPMPDLTSPIKVETPYFTYAATSAISGRTLRLHRDFTSSVTGQVCTPEVESATEMVLGQVNRHLVAEMSFNGTLTAAASESGPVRK